MVRSGNAANAPATRLKQFFRISRLLAGQLDFSPAIRAVAAEIAAIVPHDHLDVCIVQGDGRFHTAYETGIDTAWGQLPLGPVINSPIRALLMGEVDDILTDDAMSDLRFRFEGAFHAPIFDHGLRSRLHVPMIVHGEIIGALSCSLTAPARYGPDDLRNARYVAELLSPYFFALRAAEQARQSAIVEAEARAREEGLRQGALRLTEALEQERQRIGMDLHDQTLADLTRLARRIDRLAAGEQVAGSDVADLGRALHLSMQSLRQIIEEAKPSVLHLFGFADAVENHLDRAIREAGGGLSGRLNDSSDGAIDALEANVAIALFRIVQEAVNNAVSHARARHVTVDLALTGGASASTSASTSAVEISITDDGRGPVAERSGRARGPGGRGGGRGIGNMRTRARLISARFAIGPGPDGRGTRVAVTLPLSARAAALDKADAS